MPDMAENRTQMQVMTTRMTWAIALGMGLLLLVGCSPGASNISEPLPTLMASPTAPVDLTSAQRAGMQFIDAWKRGDTAAMYALLTVASQETNAYDAFERVYATEQNKMGLVSLDIQPRSITRSGDRLALLTYSATFETDLVGTFTDENRELTLVLDRSANEWRVAWSLGDIFAEMGRGAQLVFEASPPRRASIYDRNGVVLADQNGVYVQVWFVKEDIPDIERCVALLSEALDTDADLIARQINRAGMTWRITPGEMDVLAYEIYQDSLRRDCAATFQQQPVRRYPLGALMPHIIGHVGYPDADQIPELQRQGFNAETIIGQSGIERSWDETLRGKPGGRLSLIGPGGARLRVLAEVAPVVPESLWLTIDSDLQQYVIRAIAEEYQRFAAGWGSTSKGAAAVVMDVNTGEIRAMVSYPSFEGNALNPFPMVGREVAAEELERLADDDRTPQLNRATQGIFAVGSTMKVIGAVAAIDSGIYTPDTRYVSTGTWRFEGDVRRDWLPGGHGSVNTAQALTHSCNSCFYQIGLLMDQQDPYLLPSYARRMGLGVPTGLTDLIEDAGTIPDPDYVAEIRQWPWTYADAVSMSIGQGYVQATPLQVARMYGALANGGDLMRPRLVREQGILDQRTFVAEPEINGRLDVDPIALDVVREGLCAVTTASYGTAEFIFRNVPELQSIGVCAKTGTAEDPANGLPHSWFLAWAPRDEPEIVVAVMIQNAGDGSAHAAPVTRRILDYYFFGVEDRGF